MRSFVADGNFKADHLKQKNDKSDVWLTNGEGFMTNTDRYEAHLALATETKQVPPFFFFSCSFCNFTNYSCRSRHVTDTELNLMAKRPITPPTVRGSAVIAALDMAALHLVHWSISRKEKDR